MPYLTAFVPPSAQPPLEAATPAALYARCAAAGYLIQELAALLYREGNVPFDHMLLPYTDALLLTGSQHAFLGDFLCARVDRELTARLPGLLRERVSPILPIRWELSAMRGQPPFATGLLEGGIQADTLYTGEKASAFFTPDGRLRAAEGDCVLLELASSGWDASLIGADWQVRRNARLFFSLCEVAARLAGGEGGLPVYAANGRLWLLAPWEKVPIIKRKIMNYSAITPFAATFSVVIRKRFVL